MVEDVLKTKPGPRRTGPPLLAEQLSDLDGVGCRALTDLVAAAPEGDATRGLGVRDVAAYATDPNQVLVGGVHRHGEAVVRILGTHVVNELHARSGSQRSTGLFHRNIALKLERNALGVRTQHGHAHAGAVHAQLGQVHDLAALVLQFHLLGGKAFLLDAANLRNQVARQLGGKCARLGNLLAAAQGGQLGLELGHTGSAGTQAA